MTYLARWSVVIRGLSARGRGMVWGVLACAACGGSADPMASPSVEPSAAPSLPSTTHDGGSTTLEAGVRPAPQAQDAAAPRSALDAAAPPPDTSAPPLDAAHGADAEVSPRAGDGGLAPDGAAVTDSSQQPDAGPVEAGAPPGACSGKPGSKRGKSSETVSAGGATRKFVLHRPASLDPNQPAPIVIIPHGYTQTGEDMYRITRYWEIGDKEGVVTIYPEGASASGPWNVGQPSCQSVWGLLPLGSANDQAFLEAMVKFVESDQCVDREHIFVAGFSMGGYLANATGCQSDLVRAIVPHSAGSHDLSACKGKRKPVLMFHGNGDRLIPYDCGKETRQRWVKRNGCSAEVEVKPIKNGSCEYHKGCPADGQVTFCTLNAMNHGWAGGAAEQVALYPDDYPKFESSTQLSWAFFKQYAW